MIQTTCNCVCVAAVAKPMRSVASAGGHCEQRGETRVSKSLDFETQHGTNGPASTLSFVRGRGTDGHCHCIHCSIGHEPFGSKKKGKTMDDAFALADCIARLAWPQSSKHRILWSKLFDREQSRARAIILFHYNYQATLRSFHHDVWYVLRALARAERGSGVGRKREAARFRVGEQELLLTFSRSKAMTRCWTTPDSLDTHPLY